MAGDQSNKDWQKEIYNSNRREKDERGREKSWRPLAKALGIVDENAASNLQGVEDKEFLEKVLPRLGERVRSILHSHYFDEKTLEEVAKEFGITDERVRQIENQAFREIRHFMKTRHGGL